jgi:hypothetical protein
MKLSISDSLKRVQERAVASLSAVSGHKIANAYYKVADSACGTMQEKGVVAGLLNNFAKIMDSDLGQAMTHSGDFGPYVMEVWPLVTAWYPDFPLKDLISVQDMDKPLAYMFFSVLKTGTAKADTQVGDVVETPLGMRTIRGKYPTGEIVGESITKGQISGSQGTLLAYAPLNVATIPGYLEKTRVFVGSDTYKARTVENGFVLFAKGDAQITKAQLSLEVATGVLSGTIVTALAAENSTEEAIRVNYVWNLDYASTENIQKVKEQVELRPMEATPRALMLEWTLFSEYLKKSQFGQDIREDNTKRILNLIYQYQVRYILDELYDGAEGSYKKDGVTTNLTTISLAIDNNYSLEVQAANVIKQLKVVANAIELASGRMEGNRIVCGQNFKAYLESLPNTLFQPAKNEASAFSGPRKIGTFNTFEVYYDPYRGADEGFMTYRGNEWYDAAYYLGEYMPIVPTDAIALGVTVRSSFVSMEAYRYDKPTCTFKLKFTL